MQILLSRTQAGPSRRVKQEQEEISQNHVQRLNLIPLESKIHFMANLGKTQHFPLLTSESCRQGRQCCTTVMETKRKRARAWLPPPPLLLSKKFYKPPAAAADSADPAAGQGKVHRFQEASFRFKVGGNFKTQYIPHVVSSVVALCYLFLMADNYLIL